MNERFDVGGSPSDLLADPHVRDCRACRELVAAAVVLTDALAATLAPIAVPTDLSHLVADAVQQDHRRRGRLRTIRLTVAGVATAACLLVAMGMWITSRQPSGPPNRPDLPHPPGGQFAQRPNEAPPPRPVRIDTEIAKAGDALLGTSRAIVEPAEAAPELVASVSRLFTAPRLSPVSADLEPARQSLADIPDAASVGLEPVTGSARKAFDRFLRDVGAVQPASKPNS